MNVVDNGDVGFRAGGYILCARDDTTHAYSFIGPLSNYNARN